MAGWLSIARAEQSASFGTTTLSDQVAAEQAVAKLAADEEAAASVEQKAAKEQRAAKETALTYDGTDLSTVKPVCAICLEPALPMEKTACGHIMHKACLATWLQKSGENWPMHYGENAAYLEGEGTVSINGDGRLDLGHRHETRWPASLHK